MIIILFFTEYLIKIIFIKRTRVCWKYSLSIEYFGRLDNFYPLISIGHSIMTIIRNLFKRVTFTNLRYQLSMKFLTKSANAIDSSFPIMKNPLQGHWMTQSSTVTYLGTVSEKSHINCRDGRTGLLILENQVSNT